MIATAPTDLSPVVCSLLEENASASVCFETLVSYAAHQQAGDLYCSAERAGYRLSMRCDGMIRDLGRVPRSWGDRIVGYVKVEAKLDAAEHRRPQDGRILVWDREDPIDVRISLMPTFFGEDLALRVLDRRNHQFDLDRLGLARKSLGGIQSLIRHPHGLVLVSGSTGSGKTTTLYSMLSALDNGKRKINTLEDPIEFDLPGIHQSQVNPLIGLDFGHLLPAVMRQDPDVIMVGEVRDTLTAVTAVRAAVTGQLVFATLHATRAASAIHSMLGLEAHPHLLAASLRGVIAQYLLRRICPDCKHAFETTAELSMFGDIRHLLPHGSVPVLHQGRGCDACMGTGYLRRVGLFEIMLCNGPLRRLVEGQSSPDAIEEEAVKQGMVPLRESAMLAVATGVTTLEEAMRVIDLKTP